MHFYLLDTDDPDIGKTQVTYFESLFLSTDWETTTKLLGIHKLFYDIKDNKAVRELTITRDNVLSLLKVCFMVIKIIKYLLTDCFFISFLAVHYLIILLLNLLISE